MAPWGCCTNINASSASPPSRRPATPKAPPGGRRAACSAGSGRLLTSPTLVGGTATPRSPPETHEGFACAATAWVMKGIGQTAVAH
eukprot:10244592-Alexandrium_andersonii.AAC.1